MPSFNQITVIGNVVAEPTIRYTASGKAVTKIRLAINSRPGETLFLDIVLWENHAESMIGALQKGDPLLASGRLVVREYEDKMGAKRKAIEIAATTTRRLGPRRSPIAAPTDIPLAPFTDTSDDLADDDFTEIPF